MEIKRLMIGMVLIFGIMFGWQWFQGQLLRKYPQLVQQQQPAKPPATTTPTTGSTTGPATATATAPTTEPTGPASSWAILHVVQPAMAPAPTLLGSMQAKNPEIAVGADLSSQGAAVRSVTLNEFSPSNRTAKERKQSALYVFQKPFESDAVHTALLATRELRLKSTRDGQPIEKVIDLAGVTWRLLGEPSAMSAAYYIDIADGNQPVVRVVKEFELKPRNDPSKGYEVIVRQRVENKSASPLTVSSVIQGPSTPPQELESQDDRYVVSVVRKTNGGLAANHHATAKFTETEPTFDLTKKDDQPVVWFGTASAYFAAIVRPEDPKQIAKVVAETPNPKAKEEQRLVGITMTTTEQAIEPGKDAAFQMRLFFGPKSREVLKSAYYGLVDYAKTLDTSASSCQFCAPEWLLTTLVAMLGFFHTIMLKDWGLAIIVLVLVVRLVLHPITKKSTISMQRMQKLGPEMERLKQKYGDNKEELNKAMMGVYKEQGIAPMLGCLPMFLQMPIWIALYSALQNTFELRQAGFLEFAGVHLTWIKDLSQPDRLWWFANSVPLLFGLELRSINLLPILMAFVFWLQQKYTPKPATMNEQQAQQQKMMQWMTLLFPVFLYTAPSGLNLYILTSTTIGIIESKRIRDHIKQREEAEKSGKVIVDARPTRAGRAAQRGRANEEPAPKTGLAGWLQGLRDKAAAMQREAERQRNRKK